MKDRRSICNFGGQLLAQENCAAHNRMDAAEWVHFPLPSAAFVCWDSRLRPGIKNRLRFLRLTILCRLLQDIFTFKKPFQPIFGFRKGGKIWKPFRSVFEKSQKV